MSEPKNRKAFPIEEKMDIVAQVDANKETHVAMVARLAIMLSASNITVKNRRDTEKCYAQCGGTWSREEPETVTIARPGEFVGCKD